MNKITNKQANLFIPVLSILIYICHSFVLRNHYQNIFSEPVSSSLNKGLSITISYIFGTLVYCGILYSLFFIIKKNKTFYIYLKQFLICFLPLFILLLLTWPGIFKGDEFYILKAIRSYTFSSAQTGLTSLFFIACLRFLPSMAAVPFFQIVIISLIYSYIFVNLIDIYKGRNLLLVRIVFYLLPILDGCLFTLRATLVGWIFLLIMCMCLFSYKRKSIDVKTIITISILSGLVIAWRSEFIYLLLFLPIYFAVMMKLYYQTNQTLLSENKNTINTENNTTKNEINRKEYSTRTKLICGFIICFAVMFVSYKGFNLPNKIALNGQNKYPISLVISPLGNIFAQEEIRGEHAYEDIVVLSELLDVQALKNHPSFRNISQYWNIDDVLPEEQLDRFMNAAYDLILNNFDHFLYYKWKTFQYTNGMVLNDINHPVAPSLDTIYTLIYYDEDYHLSYYFMKPIFGDRVRNKIIDILACRHYDNENPKTNILYPVLYNCLPTFVIALALMFVCLFKKNFHMAFLLFTTGVQIVLIFLTAPAMFFMYYFCFYFVGYFLSAVSLLELTDKGTV